MKTGARIDARKEQGAAAFVGYLPAGFPDTDRGIRAAQELARAGADIIELGLPYSDPSMDGGVSRPLGSVRWPVVSE